MLTNLHLSRFKAELEKQTNQILLSKYLSVKAGEGPEVQTETTDRQKEEVAELEAGRPGDRGNRCQEF